MKLPVLQIASVLLFFVGSLLPAQEKATFKFSSPRPQLMTLNVDEPFTKGTMLLWSPAFQACWDKLRAVAQLKTIDLKPPSVTGKQLNEFVWNQSQVLPPDTLVYGGENTEALRQEILAGVKKLTGEAPMLDLPAPSGQKDQMSLLCFTEIFRVLRFEPAFFKAKKGPMKFQNFGKFYDLAYFGTVGEYSAAYRNVVTVLEDDFKGTFTVEVKPKDGDETLILMMDDGVKSMREAFDKVNKLRANPLKRRDFIFQGRPYYYDPGLDAGDTFKVPEIKLKAIEDFRPLLKGLFPIPGKTDPYLISYAKQEILFEMNHEGVKVRIEAGIGADPFGGPPQKERPKPWPKVLIFDRPFLFFLWRKGADLPYLAGKMDGTDWMVGYTPPSSETK